MPHNKHNTLKMSLPSGRIWPWSLLWGCISREAINTPSLLLGLSVGPSVRLPACLPACWCVCRVAAAWRQPASEHSVTSVTARGVLWALDSRRRCGQGINTETWERREIRYNMLQYSWGWTITEECRQAGWWRAGLSKIHAGRLDKNGDL